jgi:ribosomal protein S18 acetylase RimI-like enzyme
MMQLAAARSTEDINARRIEEASLNAVQTPRQLFYDGWLLRLSPGKAKRARCVTASFWSTLPVGDKIAHCERVYRQHALPLLFRLTPFDRPADLDRALAAAGYVAFDETLVQAVSLTAPFPMADPPPDVTITDIDVDRFVDAVGALRNSPVTERDAQRERLAQLPLASRRVVVAVSDQVVCTAQTAVDGDLAGLFDVTTADAARRRGHATLACVALLEWARRQGARHAYLQVDATNEPAIATYRKFGFESVYRYHYRGRVGECR